MKTIIKNTGYRLTLLLVALLSTVYAFAQDEGTTTSHQSESITKTTSTQVPSGGYWYAAPWVWIVGAAVFILLLVAILQAGRTKTN